MARVAVDGPFGRVTVTEAAGRLTRLGWSDEAVGPDEGSALLDEAAAQLRAYFAGARQAFDLPLELGTGFRAEFLAALIAIPFGETRRYGELAAQLGVSAQAIGQACGANPLPLIIPCHRVLGATGLGGFSAPGGVETKVALLRHEGAAGLLI